MRLVLLVLLLPAAVLTASTTAANAYMGPGAGLSAIGSLLSVVAALLFAIVGFIWYPVKRLLRRGRPAIGGSPDGAPEKDATAGR
ncbi:MAG TPA: hypothetical protein VFX06_11135 [Stellaceae bacterium]|jgi:hypothetical protein|nr:hypothetical protein [Stellaceae bacterium]